ncbi:MAG: Ribosome-binding factor [Bacteroidota bacterium]
MSIRTERVAGEIQKALASPLRSIAEELSAGFISVTEVRLSADLQIARVFLSVFGGKGITPAEVLEQIDKHYVGRLRHSLATSLRLRYTPQLQLFIDDSLDRAQRIEAILDRVRPVDGGHNDDTNEND